MNNSVKIVVRIGSVTITKTCQFLHLPQENDRLHVGDLCLRVGSRYWDLNNDWIILNCYVWDAVFSLQNPPLDVWQQCIKTFPQFPWKWEGEFPVELRRVWVKE